MREEEHLYHEDHGVGEEAVVRKAAAEIRFRTTKRVEFSEGAFGREYFQRGGGVGRANAGTSRGRGVGVREEDVVVEICELRSSGSNV